MLECVFGYRGVCRLPATGSVSRQSHESLKHFAVVNHTPHPTQWNAPMACIVKGEHKYMQSGTNFDVTCFVALRCLQSLDSCKIKGAIIMLLKICSGIAGDCTVITIYGLIEMCAFRFSAHCTVCWAPLFATRWLNKLLAPSEVISTFSAISHFALICSCH